MPLSPSADDLDFDQATNLAPRGDGAGDGAVGIEFDTAVHPLWTVGDKPNGGYLLALLGRAAKEAVRLAGAAGTEAVSAGVTYLGPPALGPSVVRTALLRRGRTASHLRATLTQEGADLVEAVFVVSTLSPSSPPRYSDIVPMEIPGPDECVRLPPRIPGGVAVGIMEAIDLRLDPSSLPFPESGRTEPDALAELRGWVRFADGRPPDATSLLFFVDAAPPPTMRIGSTGWVPTLQMSVYVRALPAPGWLRLRMAAHLVADGMVDESCTVWDSTGQVVAQATQLARLRFPD